MNSLTLNEILGEYFVYEEDLTFEGSGSFGEAYSFEYEDNKYVVKFTNREEEFECTASLKEYQDNCKDYDNSIYVHSARIFNIGSFVGSNKHKYNYYIIMEFIEVDGDLAGIWQNYRDINSGYSDEEYIDDRMYTEEEEDAFVCMLKIQDMIGANDLHGENMGYGNDGIIKGFDWDRPHGW